VSKWQIESTISGVIIGVYEGADESEALEAMAKDAGYADYAEATSVTGVDEGEILVTKVVE